MPGIIMSIQKSVADGGLQFLFIFILHKDIYMKNKVSPQPCQRNS